MWMYLCITLKPYFTLYNIDTYVLHPVFFRNLEDNYRGIYSIAIAT